YDSEIQTIKESVYNGVFPLKYKRYKDIRVEYLSEHEQVSYNQPYSPNEDQRTAIETIIEDIKTDKRLNYLLFGVTGSGKTIVYLEIAYRMLREGKSVLILVPEISLTPIMERRFIDAFGSTVAVLHSRLTPAERFRRWNAIRNGQCKVAVGPRSAVFLPLRDLGLIVIDEEQDTSYKQESPAPRYNARDVAIVRGMMESVPVLMGSATPMLESFYNTRRGKYKLLELPKRHEGSRLPDIHVVDMVREPSVGSSLSATLVSRMNETLAAGKQTLILLNRRGYARYVRCADCGKMWRCPDCDINYTFHTQTKRLICHYCGKSEKPPEICPQCEGKSISMFGAGTQRLENTLAELFPESEIARMDIDSIIGDNKLEEIIDGMLEGRINILMGTQMVGKGFDFPDIQLTGIISTDLGLSFPDFRGRESTFRLLMQAAGRAGRREIPGEVIIQSFTPDDYAIYYASQQDYESFYEEEITNRRRLVYPPFSRIILCTISASKPEKARKSAALLKTKLENLSKHYQGRFLYILGEAPAPMFKIRKLYRYQLMIKVDSVLKFNEVLRRFYPDAPMGIIPRGVRLAINIDPQDML
ncbi:MAG: primosomal protein N', partial [candidate division Zixibacteria bacterium]|nr:primosomal protein N' [candidate division Zixibacteria bacterium]